MSLLKTLVLNLVMLGVTVGVAYWALDHDEPRALLPASVTRPNPEPSPKTSNPSPPAAPAESPSVAAVKAMPPVPSAPPPAKVAEIHRRPVIYPINLNTAKVEEFMELPGIGEKLAQRIVAYRRTHGKFRTVEDLRDVKGIGKKRFDRLRPLITTAPS